MLFFEMEKKTNFVHYFNDETRLQSLDYLADIFEQLNKFNLRGQGPDTTFCSLKMLCMYLSKIYEFGIAIKESNFAMLEKLLDFEVATLQMKPDINENLQSLKEI